MLEAFQSPDEFAETVGIVMCVWGYGVRKMYEMSFTLKPLPKEELTFTVENRRELGYNAFFLGSVGAATAWGSAFFDDSLAALLSVGVALLTTEFVVLKSFRYAWPKKKIEESRGNTPE